MGKPARLITIPFSHYSEKARWALDWTGLPYVEDAYMPGVHRFVTRRFSKKGSVPVLVTRHGALTDSADILNVADAHAPIDRRLYPRDEAAAKEVAALEGVFNRELGKAARVVVYFHALPRPEALCAVLSPGLSARQRLIFPRALPLLAPVIRRQYRVDAENAARSTEALRRIFADLSARLASSRYLVGDAFTAADLTFSALAAPAILPEGHPRFASDLSPMKGSELEAFVRELRATKAGEHVLRMYREHRRR